MSHSSEPAHPEQEDGVLRLTGWYPGRRVPFETWERFLAEHGFVLHEAARRFPAEFGGLTTERWSPGPATPKAQFSFDPSRAARLDAFTRFNEKAGKPLCPIGVANHGRGHLGMAVNGDIYLCSADEETVDLLAHDVHDALAELGRTPWALPDNPGESLPEPAAEVGTRWSAETDRVLRLAGWRPGRSVSTTEWETGMREQEWPPMHDAARRFLTEFGGLVNDRRGPGRTMARTGFRLDPLDARWDEEIFDVLSEEAGTALYPLGSVDRGNQYLGMAADGTVYVGMDTVRLLARTADEALEKLAEGIA